MPFYALDLPFKSNSRAKCAEPGLCVAEENKMLPQDVHQSNDLRFGFVFAACPLLRKRLAPKHKLIGMNKKLGKSGELLTFLLVEGVHSHKNPLNGSTLSFHFYVCFAA